jgi:3-deoxy-D-manno-octulosonate 8-phosphate phosphatase (KDO 8-P phosphatase)
VQRIPPDLARRIRLVALDVDGVLTDGGIYLGATERGERVEMKRFEITDGLGIHLMKEVGIEVAIITGRESLAVQFRAEELGVRECHQDASAAKLPIMQDLLRRLDIAWEETAYLGDDLPDIPLLKRVGLPAAVANAAVEVKALTVWSSGRAGGSGAVREFAEALLHARGQWESGAASYVRHREGDV